MSGPDADFAHFDRDGDGRIDAGEFRQLLQRLGLRRSATVMQRMFDAIDANGDGHISREEFVAWWAQGGEAQ